MSDMALLRSYIDKSGYKINFVAGQCGLTYQGLLNKLNGESSFKTQEAGRLKDMLNIPDGDFNTIFFSQPVAAKPTKL